MLEVTKFLPEDPEELRVFTALLLAEVKSQATLIEKLRHQLASHRSHRFGASSETIEQLQLALEATEISIARMTAKLRLPDEEEKDKPKRQGVCQRSSSHDRMFLLASLARAQGSCCCHSFACVYRSNP